MSTPAPEPPRTPTPAASNALATSEPREPLRARRRRKRFDNPLQQYWRILLKRRVTVLVCFLAMFITTWLYTESLAPRYRARAKLLIEDTTKWLGIRDSARLSMDWYLTQFEILKSQPIISKVVESLDLEQSYRVSPSKLSLLRSKLTRSPLPPRELSGPAIRQEIQRSLSIQATTATGLVNITFTASDPVLARDITNALVHTFIDENLNQRIQLSMQASEYLTERLQKISDRIQAKQSELEDFEEREGIQMAPDLTLDNDQLAQFTTQYIDTRTRKWELQERLRVLERLTSARGFDGIAGPELEGSPLEARSKELFEARLDLDRLQKQGYKSKHPKVIEAIERIDTLRKRLQFETRTHIAGLKSELAALEQRERSLDSTIQQLRPSAALERKKRATYEHLQREVDIQKGFYEVYNQQLRRLQLLDDVRPTSVRVVEEASLPTRPVSPNKRRNLLFGIFSGLLFGLFMAFFRDYLDDTIKTADEVEDHVDIPVLGTVPVIQDSKDRGRLLPWQLDTSSLVIEAYRGLRTNLQFFETDRPLRSLLISSAGPGEGKSTTSANIALTLVQMGKRVCLIDTDMRRPMLHRLFGKPNKSGITSMLADLSESRSLLVPTGHDQLYLLPCGPVPPNPAELLASKRMERVLQTLKDEFDYVIFDSPPVLMVTDALVLSSLVDGVLLVIHSGSTRIGAVQEAYHSLSSIGANVIGAVINRVQFRNSRYYPYYSKYYGKYGYTYGRTGKRRSALPESTARRPSRKT